MQLTCKDNGSSSQKYYSVRPISSSRVQTKPRLTETNGNGGEITHCPAVQLLGQLWPQVKSSETFEALENRGRQSSRTPSVLLKQTNEQKIRLQEWFWYILNIDPVHCFLLLQYTSMPKLLVSFVSCIYLEGFLATSNSTTPHHPQPTTRLQLTIFRNGTVPKSSHVFCTAYS